MINNTKSGDPLRAIPIGYWRVCSGGGLVPGLGAGAAAVERASKSVRDLRVAEVTEQEVVIEKGKISAYRTKLKISFKFEDG